MNHPAPFDPQPLPRIHDPRKPPIVTNNALIIAFIQGAKWWEYSKTGATMWQSDQEDAEKEANRRARNNTLGL